MEQSQPGPARLSQCRQHCHNLERRRANRDGVSGEHTRFAGVHRLEPTRSRRGGLCERQGPIIPVEPQQPSGRGICT